MRIREAGWGRGRGLEGSVGDWVVKLFESYRRVLPRSSPSRGENAPLMAYISGGRRESGRRTI